MINDKKVVLVTGGTSGIGKATARLLREKGFITYASGRNLSKAKDIEELGVKLLYIDLENEDTMVEGVKKIISENGRIDILINNAGYGIAGAIEEVPIEEARRQFEVNLFAQMRLCQLVIPYMVENKWGKIINITSIASLVSSPVLSWYCASKVALSFMSLSLRSELRQFGIDVVEVAPGGIKTNWPIVASENLNRFSKDPKYSSIDSKVFNFFQKSIESSPPPEIVAKKILKIIRKKRTKPRYFVPSYGYIIDLLLRLTSKSSIDNFYKFMFK